MKAIIIEENNKGYYYRYALTPEEFEKEFAELLAKGMWSPCEEAESYTIRPGVHVWYMETDTTSDLWQKFFTDMSWGLSDCDIKDDNLAMIDKGSFKSLLGHVNTDRYRVFAQYKGDCVWYVLGVYEAPVEAIQKQAKLYRDEEVEKVWIELY